MEQKEALLVIDIQNDYFPGGAYPLVNPEAAAKKARQLLEDFRSKDKTVVHVQHISTRDDAGFFLPGTAGVDIHNEVLPANGERVITKHTPNSFHETELLAYLRQEGITDLAICGMMTQMCVDTGVRAAKHHGFNVTLIADACATLDLEFQGEKVPAKQVQASFLSALQFFYADVITAGQYLAR
jgi:nicotinamidase-related amidase